MQFYTCENLEKTGLCKTIYTGINSGYFAYDSMNNISDYEKLGAIFNITPDSMARVYQKHTSNVKIITKEDCGVGITRACEKQYFDGMITNEKNILLCTVEADCVPVYLLDTQKKVIAMLHSGWRGTVLKIISNAINLMTTLYDTNPQDILCYIGPHNCEKCYEVGNDVKIEFSKSFSQDAIDKFFIPYNNNNEQKYLLNLTGFITKTLTDANVQSHNIMVSPYCTFHDNKFDSFRKTHDLKSRMLTAIMLT